eukprot:4833640-Amphidinium_carterae.1
MYTENSLRYIEWSRCARREQEVAAEPRDPVLTFDPKTGVLKQGVGQSALQSDLSTDLLLCFALRRRGLALEQANI